MDANPSTFAREWMYADEFARYSALKTGSARRREGAIYGAIAGALLTAVIALVFAFTLPSLVILGLFFVIIGATIGRKMVSDDAQSLADKRNAVINDIESITLNRSRPYFPGGEHDED